MAGTSSAATRANASAAIDADSTGEHPGTADVLGSLASLADQLRALRAAGDLGDRDVVRMITEVRDRILLGSSGQASDLIDSAASSGDLRYDAMLAALAEELAMHHDLLVPPWASTPEKFLRPCWFVSPYPAQRTIAFREAPGPYAIRGVFIARRSLERT